MRFVGQTEPLELNKIDITFTSNPASKLGFLYESKK